MEPSLRNSHSLRLFIGSNLNHQFFISATTALRRTRVRGVSLDSRIVALPPSQHTVSEYNLWMAFTKSIRKNPWFPQTSEKSQHGSGICWWQKCISVDFIGATWSGLLPLSRESDGKVSRWKVQDLWLIWQGTEVTRDYLPVRAYVLELPRIWYTRQKTIEGFCNIKSPICVTV